MSTRYVVALRYRLWFPHTLLINVTDVCFSASRHVAGLCFSASRHRALGRLFVSPPYNSV